MRNEVLVRYGEDVDLLVVVRIPSWENIKSIVIPIRNETVEG